ncbi:uncharacterized protein LOC107615149 [Arachis ipaensis]|uniref:uncharacterized protein LOC107615149 n=1 Tax=Arachis ipaensis TaxID=130454 RepID=UPI0007AF0E0A|nr:uncharacterized protein LOC107615149 [Arachis ipaensis]XP_025678134.1 uncharacterized protein LOC112777972 [Arachis hypogaea]
MVDVEGSSRGSAPNLPIGVIEGTSTAVPTGQPATPLVLSPSFAADLPVSGDDLGDGRSFGQLAAAMGSEHVVDGAPAFMEPSIIGDESDDEEDTAVAVGAQTHSSSGTQQYPQHFTTLDLEAMNQAANVDQHHPVIHGERPSVIGTDEFEVGQRFETKEEAVLTIKSYNIRRGVEYKVFESDQLKYHGKCVQFGNGCNWLIRVTMRQRKGYWKVRKYNEPHTCLATEISMDHRQLDYHVICASILSLVMADASVSVKVLQNAVSSKFGFKPSYRKVWIGKQKAIAQIYGDWEESYNHIPRWIIGVELYMPGTIALLRTSLVRIGKTVDASTVFFHRLFWTFPPCIEAFKYCKSLISIDGTHLYGKYGGTLLMAIAQDGNSNILPVAFGLVEGENTDSWKFFLTNLCQHVTPKPGILVISDRHNAIKAALLAEDGGWLPPSVYRAFCVRHIAANFALSYKSKEARRILVNAVYAKTEEDHRYYMDILRKEDPAMVEWCDRIGLELWTQYRDGGRRYGHMTTNIFECINAVFKGTRNLPAGSLVKSTYGRLAELLVRKGKEAESQVGAKQEFCQTLMKAIERNLQASRNMWVDLYDRGNSEFVVEELAPTAGRIAMSVCRVSLSSCTCDCGYFQTLHYPCRHVLADDLLPIYEGPRVIPDPGMMQAAVGRPRSTRIRNSMDEADPDRPKRCGLCRTPGHTRRNCPQRPGASGSHEGSNA